jgi:hypothetical protein
LDSRNRLTRAARQVHQQVHHARGDWFGAGFENDLFRGIDGGQVIELALSELFWRPALDEIDTQQTRSAALSRRFDRPRELQSFLIGGLSFF